MEPVKHSAIRIHILQSYFDLNQIKCPWDGSEGRCLDKIIKGNPSWSLEDFRKMITNYFTSEGVNGDRPRKWMPNVSRYARGPLDKFGHPKGTEQGKESLFDRALRKANAEDGR